MDFSNNFTGRDGKGISGPPRKPVSKPNIGGSRKPNLISRSRTTINNTKNKRVDTPVVGTTRAMQLREMANKNKYKDNSRLNTGRLETIREEPRGGLRHSNSPMRHSERKPWQTNRRPEVSGYRR